jgi:hypothetical protein
VVDGFVAGVVVRGAMVVGTWLSHSSSVTLFLHSMVAH